MPSPRELCRGRKQLLPLVEHALARGWTVARTPGGHLRFNKPGLPPIYTSATASDHRSWRNARAQLDRAERAAATDGRSRD
ncbi:type II toxin-antitoxin system HicA family toxin [Chitinimonas lacunae]|uniref:Type II toxin-antitoxin system HicA family toxin n=1 Tax=Chitinimonas lacunae TaxID=1963018 RepID=A0ABV8MRB1_9NEIS